MEEIEKQQSVDGSESIDAFCSVMGPEHPGHLRLYGRGVTKCSLKIKASNSDQILSTTIDAVRQMQEKMQRMEERMEEQRRTIQQDVTANIIPQLQRAGLISANILTTLCIPSPGEATSAQQANQQICRLQVEVIKVVKLNKVMKTMKVLLPRGIKLISLKLNKCSISLLLFLECVL